MRSFHIIRRKYKKPKRGCNTIFSFFGVIDNYKEKKFPFPITGFSFG